MSAKILLVEDNGANRYLATFLLEGRGFTVVHAANGFEALRQAGIERPDLILMDIQMPEMDGYEAARLLRETPEVAQIPIVAVTSYAMAGDRERALQLGFVGYLEKPISTETFVAEIERFLPRKESLA
jgi:two-component system, cell cycle response regulator DivK